MQRAGSSQAKPPSHIGSIIIDSGPWAIWQNRADTDRCIRWARECWDALRPFYESSAYVNAVDDAISDDDERVRSAYGQNFERLVSLKNRYDPTNLFRLTLALGGPDSVVDLGGLYNAAV